MNAPQDKLSREERLAAKLRENLRRRKAQARAIDARDGGGGDSGDAGVDGPAQSGEGDSQGAS